MPKSQQGHIGGFVGRGQAAVLLEPAEKALYFVALAVGLRVHLQWLGTAGIAGNDAFDSVPGAAGAVFVAVVGGFGQYFARLQAREQGLGLGAVTGLGAAPQPRPPAAAAAAEALGCGAAFFGPPKAGRPVRQASRVGPSLGRALAWPRRPLPTRLVGPGGASADTRFSSCRSVRAGQPTGRGCAISRRLCWKKTSCPSPLRRSPWVCRARVARWLPIAGR